ncbi:MAG: hypothetical protein DMF64_21875 [Acidobacteria bacterium]|nr:MAG: hypothetical protein DMF64_21875 [Acidobacteriota bacterium]
MVFVLYPAEAAHILRIADLYKQAAAPYFALIGSTSEQCLAAAQFRCAMSLVTVWLSYLLSLLCRLTSRNAGSA